MPYFFLIGKGERLSKHAVFIYFAKGFLLRKRCHSRAGRPVQAFGISILLKDFPGEPPSRPTSHNTVRNSCTEKTRIHEKPVIVRTFGIIRNVAFNYKPQSWLRYIIYPAQAEARDAVSTAGILAAD